MSSLVKKKIFNMCHDTKLCVIMYVAAGGESGGIFERESIDSFSLFVGPFRAA